MYSPKRGRRRSTTPRKPHQRRRPSELSLAQPQQATVYPSLTWALQDIISLVVQNFVPAYQVSPRYDTSRFKSRVCGSWIEVLPNLSTAGRHGEALTSSIKAFGIAILSMNHNGYAPVSDALAAQGSALQLLQQALRHVHPVLVNELSVAVMCFRISELILPTSSNSSSAHSQGLSLLMQLNSPEFYSDGVSHQIFNGARPSILIQAICTRKPTFLVAKEWQTIPYKENKPSTLQKLMTEALPIPSILAHIDSCRISSPNQTAVYGSLIALTFVRKRLEAWHRSFTAAAPYKLLYHTVESNGRRRLSFPSLTIANRPPEVTGIQSGIRQENDPTTDAQQAVDIAKKIFQSVDFLLEEDMKLFGSNSMAFPLKVAYECIMAHGSRDEAAECKAILQEVGRKGYQYLVDFATT